MKIDVVSGRKLNKQGYDKHKFFIVLNGNPVGSGYTMDQALIIQHFIQTNMYTLEDAIDEKARKESREQKYSNNIG